MGLFSRSDHPEPDDLAAIPLFAGLGEDEVRAVAKLAKRREVTAGETLIDQGRYGDSFFVIADGQALVYIGGQYVASVGPNTAVGEASLVEHRPRNATVVAEGDMVVAEFGITDFNKLLERYPSARLRIFELVNGRLKENEDRS